MHKVPAASHGDYGFGRQRGHPGKCTHWSRPVIGLRERWLAEAKPFDRTARQGLPPKVKPPKRLCEGENSIFDTS